ncbi:outer envelope pore protein 24B, chloroplastic-like isoform X1 [Zingiber officinale]|uniref:outer envelope pore protein 24B, chloroplastic-like isoform X1 n=1 Tax=Zingiber officinale TaxID=94328 RepID=UPI001C4C2089|nr:outer envelope pore protein 24B, chloroplastic-like isoform X1 [Zingiber officinale]
MKTTLKGRYEANKGATAVSTLAVNAGDVRIKASMTDATFIRGPSLNGLALSVEKPGAFILDYHLPANDVRFQFMNSVRLMDKTVNLTYIHAQGSNRTTLDGSVAFNPSDKVNVSYTFGEPSACKVKYVYAHGELGRTVLEPCYDVSKNTWDFAVTRKFEEGDSLKATYHTSTNNLDLEWCRDPKDSGSFKDLSTGKTINSVEFCEGLYFFNAYLSSSHLVSHKCQLSSGDSSQSNTESDYDVALSTWSSQFFIFKVLIFFTLY